MKFTFENFGQVATGSVTLGELTIISGPNSTGKTYISYAIHSFLRNFFDLSNVLHADAFSSITQKGRESFDLSELLKNEREIYVGAARSFMANAARYFSVSSDFFKGSRLSVSPTALMSSDRMLQGSYNFSEFGFLNGFKEDGSDQLVVTYTGDEKFPLHAIARAVRPWLLKSAFGASIPNPFPITSERTGVSLFWKDLHVSRNQLIEMALESKNKEINFFDLAFSHTSRYALPIKENIDSTRGFEEIAKQRSFLIDNPDPCGVLALLEKMTGGDFSHDGQQLNYTFKVKGEKKRKSIPIYVASSAVKSLFLLNLYLRHVAKPGDVLIIDEPELNLHPGNQRLMAALVVRLVNAGVRVCMTTHSDFIVREISARIALGTKRDSLKKFLSDNDLTAADLLNPEQVTAFTTAGNRISAAAVGDSGIDMATLNDAIGASASFYEDALLA
jgi:AAA domain, putative AbiEii toxin, Type IV TA system